MTRMFKKLVESSRKRLSKAAAQPPQNQGESLGSAVQVAAPRKPDFEPLESRVLFSGVGSGFNKKSVTFIDAWGDSVLVRLIGGPAGARFDITLDGGAANNADIQNITINGKRDLEHRARRVRQAQAADPERHLHRRDEDLWGPEPRHLRGHQGQPDIHPRVCRDREHLRDDRPARDQHERGGLREHRRYREHRDREPDHSRGESRAGGRDRGGYRRHPVP